MIFWPVSGWNDVPAVRSYGDWENWTRLVTECQSQFRFVERKQVRCPVSSHVSSVEYLQSPVEYFQSPVVDLRSLVSISGYISLGDDLCLRSPVRHLRVSGHVSSGDALRLRRSLDSRWIYPGLWSRMTGWRSLAEISDLRLYIASSVTLGTGVQLNEMMHSYLSYDVCLVACRWILNGECNAMAAKTAM